MPPYNLKYFGFPGLGEPVRLLLHLGKFEWENEIITVDTWPALKPSVRFGQLPQLTTPDGKVLVQSKAIVRFLAKQVSLEGTILYPEDPLTAFDVDEMIDAFEDVLNRLAGTLGIQDNSEKEEARQKLFADDGYCWQLLKKIDSLAGEKYIVGDTLTVADLWAFYFLNLLRCGFWKGVPEDYLDRLPKLKGLVASFGALPEVAEYYSRHDAAANPMYAVFK